MKWISVMSVCAMIACGGGGGGGDLCDRYDEMHLGDRTGKCDLQFVGLPTRSACESGLTSCNEDDRRQLSTLLDCLGRISTCQPGQEDSWAGQVNSCFDRLDLSSRCDLD